MLTLQSARSQTMYYGAEWQELFDQFIIRKPPTPLLFHHFIICIKILAENWPKQP